MVKALLLPVLYVLLLGASVARATIQIPLFESDFKEFLSVEEMASKRSSLNKQVQDRGTRLIQSLTERLRQVEGLQTPEATAEIKEILEVYKKIRSIQQRLRLAMGALEDPQDKSEMERQTRIEKANEAIKDIAETVRNLNIVRAENPQGAKILEAQLHNRGEETLRILLDRAEQIKNSHKSQDLLEYKKIQQLLSALLIVGQDARIQFGVVLDPTKPISTENVGKGVFTSVEAPVEQLKKEAPKSFDFDKAVQSGTYQFSTQYTYFLIAHGILAVAQLGIAYQNNPQALEEWMQTVGSTFGMGGLAFAAFMATSHPVAKKLHAVQSGYLPKSMIPYISMTAGAIASNVLHEFAADKATHRCFSSFFKDREACEKSYTNWVLHRKIMQYAPLIASLMGSTFAAGLTHAGIAKAAKTNVSQMALRGLRIVKTTGTALTLYNAATASAATGAATSSILTPFGGMVVAIGNFVVFLAFDHMLTDPVNSAFATFNFVHIDLVAMIDKLGGHKDFWFRQDGWWAIKDPFDVEATNLRTSHAYLLDLFADLKKSKWSPPDSPFMCGLENRKYNERQKLLPTKLQSLRKYKTGEEMRCEVLSQPFTLLERYSQLQSAWRSHLLQDYLKKDARWSRHTANFWVTYLTAYKFYSYMAKMKFAQARRKGQTLVLPRRYYEGVLRKMMTPDIGGPSFSSVEGIEQLEGSSLKLLKIELQAHHPSRVDKVYTPKFLDFLIASMACGGANTDQDTGFWNDIVNVYYNITGLPKMVTTPFGSKVGFLPPKIVKGSNAICKNFPYEYDASVKSPLGIVEKDYIFSPGWTDENGKKYESLLEYVFDNMDPEIWDSKSNNTDFDLWWNDTVKDPVELMWEDLKKDYEGIVQNDFWPVLKRRHILTPCSLKSVPQPDHLPEIRSYQQGPQRMMLCEDIPGDYRVSLGVLQSMEIEMKIYLRALLDLYNNLPGEKTEEQNHEFVQTASRLILNLFPKDFKSKSLTDLEEVNKATHDLAKLVEKALEFKEPQMKIEMTAAEKMYLKNALPEDQKTLGMVRYHDHKERALTAFYRDFRQKMAAALIIKVQALYTERAFHLNTIQMMSFNAENRFGVKGMDTPAPPKNILNKAGRQ